MDSIVPKPEIVKPPGAKTAQETPEPLLSSNQTRVLLGRYKGCLKIDHPTLIRLVRHEGLPKHLDPFGSGKWCFLASEIAAWFKARMSAPAPKPLPGPGRPPRKIA